MKMIKFLPILALVLAPQAFADSYELKLKVTSRVGNVLFASGRGQRVVAIVCRSSSSADLVFPVMTDGALPELTLENYRRGPATRSPIHEHRSPYRPFSAENAAEICAAGEQEYTLEVTGTEAKIMSKKAITVEAPDIIRKPL